MDLSAIYKKSRQKVFDAYQVQPETKEVYLGNHFGNIHYLEKGTGRPLLLIHGGGNCSSEWINIMRPLSQHFRLFAMDTPGHGLNNFFNYRRVDFRNHAAKFIREFTKALHLDRVDLVANSIGGFYGINFALKFPQKVENLILIGAPAGIHREVPLPLRLMGTRGINRLIMQTVAKPTLENTASFHQQVIMYDVKNIKDVYLEHITHHMMLKGRTIRNLLESVVNLRGWKEKNNITDDLARLDVPVHFIWGENDAFFPPDRGSETVSKIPNYTFQTIREAGHCPWLDQPEKCISLILSAVNRPTSVQGFKD